jgi:hypothetical protein
MASVRLIRPAISVIAAPAAMLVPVVTLLL